MATTITIKLNKEATQFQAGDNLGFGIRGGVQYYDRETKQKEWTNYEAVVFAKPGAQSDFYAQSLVAGSVVEVTGLTQKIKQFQGQNGLIISIELLDAKIGMIHTGQQAPQQQQRQAPQQRPQQAPQQNRQAPQQAQRPQQNQGQQQYNQQPNLPDDDWV
jgi:single-stranded DNA-binding protein